jgi:ribonucleoside-diphosphate reductase alpha chain
VDYIFRWLGSRFLSTEEKANLGLQPAAVVDSSPPSPAAATIAEAIAEPIASTPIEEPSAKTIEPKTTEPDAPKATAVAAEPAESSAPVVGELKVIATNGHAANGHAANGNGKAVSNGNGGSVAPITLNLGGAKVSFQTQADAPSCADCGSIMIRNGSCYKCLNCGSTSGCS